MSFKNKYDDCDINQLYKNFKILDFDNHHKLKLGILIYKLDRKLLPLSIEKLFRKLNNAKDNITTGFLLPSVNTNYKKRFVTFSGINLWKNIPDTIRKEKSLNIFKKCFKDFIFFNK